MQYCGAWGDVEERAKGSEVMNEQESQAYEEDQNYIFRMNELGNA